MRVRTNVLPADTLKLPRPMDPIVHIPRVSPIELFEPTLIGRRTLSRC